MSREIYVHKRKPNGEYELVPRDKLSAWMEKHYPARKTKMFMHPVQIERGSWVWRNGRVVAKGDAQGHGHPRTIQVIRDIEPFVNLATREREIIGGRRQRRDMMRAHNLIEVGTERLKQNRTTYAESPHDVVADLKQAYRQHGVDVL